MGHYSGGTLLIEKFILKLDTLEKDVVVNKTLKCVVTCSMHFPFEENMHVRHECVKCMLF